MVIVVLAGYLFIDRNDNKENKIEVERQLDKALQKFQTDGKALIDFDEIAPFNWDTVYIFPPYTSPETIHQQLGFEWKDSNVEMLELSEKIYLIVFVKDNKVTGYVQHERAKSDFKINNLSQMGYSRSEAIFEVIKDPLGSITIRNIKLNMQ